MQGGDGELNEAYEAWVQREPIADKYIRIADPEVSGTQSEALTAFLALMDPERADTFDVEADLQTQVEDENILPV